MMVKRVSFQDTLLAEESEGEHYDLVVDLRAHVLDDSGAYGYHHGGRSEIAGGLDRHDRAEHQAEHQ